MKNSPEPKRKLPWKVLIGALVFIILFIFWWGVPTCQQWKADRLVDELCAKDGGTKVYEPIKLPASKYSKYWLVNLPSINSARPGDDFYFVHMKTDIFGNSDSGDIGSLVIWRDVTSIVRSKDKKIMTTLISYTRRGGDPVGPWHPSHYDCPKGFSQGVVEIVRGEKK